jgi:hypothetical protein
MEVEVDFWKQCLGMAALSESIDVLLALGSVTAWAPMFADGEMVQMSDWSSNIVDCDLVDARKFAEKNFEMDPFSSVFDRSPLSNLVERREHGPQIKHWRKFRPARRLGR